MRTNDTGKLCLKISWASLFRSPVEVTLQNVYVLLIPSYGTYSQETEERVSLMLKKNIVQRLEDRYKAYLLSHSSKPLISELLNSILFSC